MAITHCSLWSIVHDKIGCNIFNAEIQDTYNIRMAEAGKSTGLGEELLYIIACYLCIQYFDSSLSFEINMLSQIHISRAAFSQQPGEPVFVKLLPNTICHIPTP